MGWLSFIPVIGKFFDAATSVLNTRQNDSLEKYRIDGQIDMSMVTADIALVQAQAALETERLKYAGGRYLEYFFGYTTGGYYAAIVIDSVFQRVFNWHYDVLALPKPASDWAGWIVGGLFLHSMWVHRK